MNDFTFETRATRVVFGAGSLARLPVEIERLGATRVMLISTPGRSDLCRRARDLLGPLVVETFARAMVHVPGEIAVASRQAAESARADCILALGGGSAIGVAKVIALDSAVPIAAVPTTYGGSEMTPIWGMMENGRKETGRNSRVQPRVVVYDPDLTLALPVSVSAASGLNAIAHCIEALYASDANPLTSSAAIEGIRLLSSSLPRIVEAPGDRDQRARALNGAWLAGFALGTVQMALHHKLCHTLGGSFGLDHAGAHAVLLPYTAAYNRDSARQAMRQAATALGVEDAPTELLNLGRTLSAPTSLQELGMSEDDIEPAASLAVERQYPNPRAVTREGITDLLAAAYRGDGRYVTVADA